MSDIPDSSESHHRTVYAVPIPNEQLRAWSSLADLGSWYMIGEAWAQIAARFLPVAASPQIVDLGCGCGKMARFFVMSPNVRYLGLDVFKPAIEWCAAAFASGYADRFEFRHLNLQSGLYNPAGEPIGPTTRLPVDDRFAELIICGSLFTHLLEAECRLYLREIARMLRPGGRLLASIHNQPAPGSAFSGGVERIDMTDDYFLDAGEAAGMRLVEKLGPVYGQEVFIVERA